MFRDIESRFRKLTAECESLIKSMKDVFGDQIEKVAAEGAACSLTVSSCRSWARTRSSPLKRSLIVEVPAGVVGAVAPRRISERDNACRHNASSSSAHSSQVLVSKPSNLSGRCGQQTLDAHRLCSSFCLLVLRTTWAFQLACAGACGTF